VTRYLHTMYRITDPERSRAFYEALGLEFRRDMDIVRNGEKEATNDSGSSPGHVRIRRAPVPRARARSRMVHRRQNAGGERWTTQRC
jgi:catechol 2,3-dioxygenase-like lactoylglutathione lyase family enzyme